MSTKASSKTHIFLHIPKTAGTTMYQILRSTYRPEQTHHFVGDPGMDTAISQFKGLSKQQKEQLTLISGHVEFGIHTHLPQPATYFTLLRDPIERTLSDYYYILRTPSHPRYSYMNENKIDIIRYIDERLIIDNFQTRTLTGNLWHGPDTCPPEALENAKHNLRTYFTVVGLMEQFDQSLLLLQQKLGWSTIFYKRANVTKHRPQQSLLTTEAIEKLHQITTLDRELYSFGQHLFAEQVQQMGAFFYLQAQLFPLRNNSHWFYWNLRQYSLRYWLRQRFGTSSK
ncbi:MAG: sulfotransferase family protein [Chloroflexi bacterium]|nr:sulfotransferase family protein [Chloroflexota bacterium]